MGYIMPFITGGLAIGNVDGRASTTGTWTQTNIAVGPPLVRTPVAAGAFNGVVGRRGVTYGGALGAGVDIAFFSNFFVRAEWQHIQFASGGSRPEISMNTARVAGAVKF